MAYQKDWNQIKENTTVLQDDTSTKLAFVGCDKCSLNCCDMKKFTRASVLLNEITDMAKLFPVVFLPTEDVPKIRLIFSIKKGVPCLYQDPGSKKCTIWGSVRPRVCKSYPFLRNIETTQGPSTFFKISFDRYCGGLRESTEGIRIFMEDGKINEEIIDNFFGRENLINYPKNLHATNEFLELVNELDLLVKARFFIGQKRLPNGDFQDVFFNFQMINQQKLSAFDTDTIMRLQSSGFINAINNHLKSLSNFPKLIQAMIEFEKST